MYLCLFEDDQVPHLLPLAYTRPVYDLRLGIRSVRETVHHTFGQPTLLLHTRAVLAEVVAQAHDVLVNRVPSGLDVLFVNGRYIPEPGPLLERLQAAAKPGAPGRVFVQDGVVVAAWMPNAHLDLAGVEAVTAETFEGLAEESVTGARLVSRLWHLVSGIHEALVRDYEACAPQYNIYERPGADIADTARLIEGRHIYVAPGATIRHGALLDASKGPIYIDAGAEVMENAVIHGPAYIGRKAQVKVAANLEGCAIGTWCKVAGEVHDAVLHSYSSKAHPGFLGNAYLGRWCNLGAATNNSNLRNDYGKVPLYDYVAERFEPSDQQFLGLFMADHSKCSINTMFNTGTVVGVSCNLFGAGFHPRHVPSFMWGSPDRRYTTYRLQKALRVAEIVMPRRNHTLTDADRRLLSALYDATEPHREAGVKM